MIAIDFCVNHAEDKDKIVDDFYALIRKGRRDNKWKKLDDWCKTYLPDHKSGKPCTFEMVIKADVDTLLEYKSYLDNNYDDVEAIMQELCWSDTRSATNGQSVQSDEKALKDSYLNTLYRTLDREVKGRSEGECKSAKALLLKKLNVKVCPYCNRNYVFSDENIISCQLDHFIPKAKYPIFMVSFYNLIPVCSTCNLKKRDVEFAYNPYQMGKKTDQLLRFGYDILGANYLKDADCLNLRMDTFDAEYERQVEVLKLRELYSFHTDVLQDILRKKETFSDVYISNLYNEFPNLFSGIDEVKTLLYGTPLESEEYGKRTLAKMTTDIVNELEGREYIRENKSNRG